MTEQVEQTDDDRGLLALATSNDRLSIMVAGNKRERRMIAVGLMVVAVLLVLNGMLTTVQTSKIIDGQHSGHASLDVANQTLKIIQDATSPQAQAAQQKEIAVLVGQITMCVENHLDHARDPKVSLIVSCPQPSP